MDSQCVKLSLTKIPPSDPCRKQGFAVYGPSPVGRKLGQWLDQPESKAGSQGCGGRAGGLPGGGAAGTCCEGGWERVLWGQSRRQRGTVSFEGGHLRNPREQAPTGARCWGSRAGRAEVARSTGGCRTGRWSPGWARECLLLTNKTCPGQPREHHHPKSSSRRPPWAAAPQIHHRSVKSVYFYFVFLLMIKEVEYFFLY